MDGDLLKIILKKNCFYVTLCKYMKIISKRPTLCEYPKIFMYNKNSENKLCVVNFKRNNSPGLGFELGTPVLRAGALTN